MDSHLTSDRVDMDDNETTTKFIVNGREYSLKIDNRYTLLDILPVSYTHLTLPTKA